MIRKDDDVTLLEQYLTFVRLQSQWKLKKVLNKDKVQKPAKLENID